MAKKMTKISDLRNQLSDVFEGLKKGTIDVKAAKQMNNVAGTIINSLKVQLTYGNFKKKPPIKWLSGKQ
jgi:hypothetical protein